MRILFFGDSITDANRDRESDASEMALGCGYVKFAAQYLTAGGANEVINRGNSGHRVVDLYARIKVDCWNLKPDVLSILIGVNDVWHEYTRKNGVSAEKFEMVYSLMIEELQQALPNLKIFILEPFVLPGSATENNEEHPARWEYFRTEVELRAQAAARVAKKYNLPFVPLQKMFDQANADAPESGYWLSDGVHPTPAGHELIKQQWLQKFQELK